MRKVKHSVGAWYTAGVGKTELSPVSVQHVVMVLQHIYTYVPSTVQGAEEEVKKIDLVAAFFRAEVKH